MTKINLIFNENRNIQKEQSRLERMGLKDELAIVSDEHLLASAKPDQVYYDSQRKCGCFWSGVLDNEDELRSLWIQYRPQSTGNSAKMLAQLYEIVRSCIKYSSKESIPVISCLFQVLTFQRVLSGEGSKNYNS